MLILNLTIHHLWGHVLAKYPQVRVFAYVDDGYIKARMSVSQEVLSDQQVPKGVTTHMIITNNSVLTPLDVDVSLVSFCPDGFIVIGVPIGTDVFVRNFVVKRVGLS